jgi:hypothetical protein
MFEASGPWLAYRRGMTINTTEAPRPGARSDLATEPSIPSKIQPGLEVPHARSESDLESRIKVRRAELVAQLRELRADRRLEASEAGDKLKARLSELSHLLKWGVVDGWASIGDKVKHRLEDWLAESRRHPPTQGDPAGTRQS